MRAVALIALLCVCNDSRSLDLKGIEIGGKASTLDVKEKLGISCGKGTENRQICNGTTTVAEIHAKINLVIDADGVVTRIWVSPPSFAFPMISEALIAKWGAPDIKRSKVQNHLGASFEQIRMLWADRTTKTFLTYEKYGSSINESTLWFGRDADLDKASERQKARVKDL